MYSTINGVASKLSIQSLHCKINWTSDILYYTLRFLIFMRLCVYSCILFFATKPHIPIRNHSHIPSTIGIVAMTHIVSFLLGTWFN